jgi:hypothetical protein
MTVIESLHKFGLICNAVYMNAAFSPNAIGGNAAFCLMALQLLLLHCWKCSQATLAAKMKLITFYGE